MSQNTCDCCMMGWGEPNEFGLCVCVCSDCRRPLSVCRYHHGQNPVYEHLRGMHDLYEREMDVPLENQRNRDTQRASMMKFFTQNIYSNAFRQDQNPNGMHDLFLLEALQDLTETIFEDVNLQTLRYHRNDEESLNMIHIVNMVSEVSGWFTKHQPADDATNILREYGLDLAMNRYGNYVMTERITRNDNSTDYPRQPFTGFSNQLAGYVIREYLMACAEYIYREIRTVIPPPDDSDDEEEEDEEEEVQRTHLAELLLEGNIDRGDLVIGECVICSGMSEPCFTLPCKHCFGLRCLSAWTKKKYETGEANTCPMCRAPY